jgi:hypothetical protein
MDRRMDGDQEIVVAQTGYGGVRPTLTLDVL